MTTRKWDLRRLESLARAQCTHEELAAVCKCSVDTLERHFAGRLKEWKLQGKALIREAMYKKAIKGDTTMLRHMGKHYLGQHDQINLTTTSEPEVRKLIGLWSDTKIPGAPIKLNKEAEQPQEAEEALV